MGLNKNDLVELTIEDMGVDGEGIGKYDGYTLFVKDAVIGDVVEAKIMKMKKNYGYARLMRILEPSDKRGEPLCAFHKQCGGCQLQALSYEEQLKFKEQKIEGNLRRIGHFDKIPMEPIVGIDTPYYYRNKAQFPVGRNKDGKIITGFYAGRTHDIIANTDCVLGDPVNEQILQIVLNFMNKYTIAPYDEKSGSGLVRHVLIRKGFTTGELMVCLIINGDRLPHADALIADLTAIEGMTSISINVNRKRNNVILGEEVKVLWGSLYIHDYIGKIYYQISPLSFFQVNPVQTRKLYDLVVEFAQFKGNEIVWDLYCGTGSISLYMAEHVKEVHGVEVIPQAIEDARANARNNKIANASFYVGKAEEVVPRLYETEKIHADVMVVDPPRKGCDEALLRTMLQMSPERIVYVSCDSATLARDLKVLCENGYELQRVKGVDCFSQTVHVETCVLLCHQKATKYATFDYTPDGSYMDELNKHASYREINEYIEAKYGYKVHSAYIAQVKRECGIEMGENYNLSQCEDYEPKLVTEEKRKAIKEALKHFNMID